MDLLKKINESEKITAFIASFLFCFTVGFCAPVDIYLTNIRDLLTPSKYIIFPCLVYSIVLSAILYTVIIKLKSGVSCVLVKVLTGVSLAFYVQGNFLQISTKQLDGSEYRVSVMKAVINLLIWAVCISVPFLIPKIFRSFQDKFLPFLAILISEMGISSLLSSRYSVAVADDTGILMDCLTNTIYSYYLSSDGKYDFSDDHNLIIILTDEYDSFSFDYTLSEYSETSSVFRDFTYYKDTVGMYRFSDKAFDYIFSGKMAEDTEYSTDLFETLKSNEYSIQMFTDISCFPTNIYEEYSENYRRYSFGINDTLRINALMYRLVMIKYMPAVTKPLFYMTSAEVSQAASSGQSYYPDNLSFYNSIPEKFEKVNGNLFKFVYVYGLHDPCNIDRDL